MKHNILLVIAAVALALVIGLVGFGTLQHAEALEDNGLTRQSVESALDQDLPAQPASAEDAALLAAASKLANEPYITRLWVVSSDGRIIYHHNGPGQTGDNVRALAGRDGQALLAALPADQLSKEQSIQILTAAALLAEGEHNDVLRPLIHPLTDANGRQIAVIGISYDINPEIGAPPISQIMGMLLLITALAIYWLALPLWTLIDARRRGEPAALWAIFTLVANLTGLLAYLIVANRPGPRHLSPDR